MKSKEFKNITTATAVAKKVQSFDAEVRIQLKDKFAKLIAVWLQNIPINSHGHSLSITTDEYRSFNNQRYLTATVPDNVEDYDNLEMVRMFGSQTSEKLRN